MKASSNKRSPFQRRKSSGAGGFSDLSMSDEFSLAMEYSESSDPESYFTRDKEGSRRLEMERKEASTGSSTFSFQNDSTSKSSHVVRYNSVSSQSDRLLDSPMNDSRFSTRSYDGELESDSELSWNDRPNSSTAAAARERIHGEHPQTTTISGSNNAQESHVWNMVSNMNHAVHRSPQSSLHKEAIQTGTAGVLDEDFCENPQYASLTNSGASEYGNESLNNSRMDHSHTTSEIPFERTPLIVPPRPRQSPPTRESHIPMYSSQMMAEIPDNSNGNGSDNPNANYHKRLEENNGHDRAIRIAASFLLDYESGRPPTLATDVACISSLQISLCEFKFSFGWASMLHIALVALFLSSFFEDSNSHEDRRVATMLNLYAIFVLVVDLRIVEQLRKRESNLGTAQPSQVLHNYEENSCREASEYSFRENVGAVRQSRVKRWRKPLALLLFALSTETIVSPLIWDEKRPLWVSILKPVALFYVSTKGRDALEALRRIAPIVARVIIMELFLILCFAVVACQLYKPFDSFQDLTTGFISLFELSTTVVNPTIWMPMYSESRTAAIFFLFFLVTSVFYLHSLVLSVVFQTYMQAATEIHNRSISNREDTVRLAFLALQSIVEPDERDQEKEISLPDLVAVENVRKSLNMMRPHYNEIKIEALIQIVDPANQHYIDYTSFRTKIRQALNASIRSARTPTSFSLVMKLGAAFIAVANFIYVIVVSSAFQADWFDKIEFPAGAIITFLGIFDLISKFKPGKSSNYFTPTTRLSWTFDGLAAVAAAMSCIGIMNGLKGGDYKEYLLVGRAIDMIRVMRFFCIFRDIVRRSAEVLPTLIGPIVLVLTALHVLTYLGMALWGGAIEVGTLGDKIEPLYDLNNFNTYNSGIVTMFQVLVVNDWHAIATVFLQASRCASPAIVYLFFIGANLIGVSTMLNVLTAFFVAAFVTKITNDTNEQVDTTRVIHNHLKPVKRVLSGSHTRLRALHDDNSPISSVPDLYEFDVLEREGFDEIMRTVTGGSLAEQDFSKQVCNFLEVFESITPSREKVGYMVISQQTTNRYGNRRFQIIAKDFIPENVLHSVISDMHSELLVLSNRGKNNLRSLHRIFPRRDASSQSLEISGSILRHQPAATIFVSRIIDKPK